MQEQVEAAQQRLVNATEDYRRVVVALLYAGCSFSEASKATGLSTNTLQRWKREAGK